MYGIVDTIPDYLIDVEPSNKDGQLKGTMPRDDKLGASSPIYEAKQPVIPRTQWRDLLDAHGPGLKNDVAKIKNQRSEGSCFPAGTLIRMEDGTHKPIESINVLDRVVTAEGNVGSVLRVVARKANALARMRVRGHNHLRATPDHRVLTKRGYVELQDLEPGDKVAFTRYMAESSKFVTTAHYIPRRTRLNMKQGTRNVGIPGKPASTLVSTVAPDVIHLNRGFGRIIGLFLAEGSTSSQKVVWTFGGHEGETLVPEMVALLKDELGCEANVRHAGNKSVIYVSIYGVHWARIFEGLCGQHSRYKCVRPEIAAGPRDFLEGVLSGWIDGDRARGNSGITVSRVMALDMFSIANALGFGPFIRRQEPVLNQYAKTRQPSWTTGYGNPDSNLGFRPIIDDDHMWRPVQDVEIEEFDGYVFDLEVEGDHSFVAEGVGVHNCTSNAGTQGWEVLHNEAFGKEAWIELSPISLYKRVGRSPSSGSTVSDNVREMRDIGALPTNAEKTKLETMGLNPAHTMPETGFSTPFPQGWKETAKYFRIQEYFDVESIEGFFSALLSGFAVHYGRAGHSILGVSAVFNQSKNGFYICYANSWAPSWGENGFGYDSEGYVRDSINRYGAFAYRTTVSYECFSKLVPGSL